MVVVIVVIAIFMVLVMVVVILVRMFVVTVIMVMVIAVVIAMIIFMALAIAVVILVRLFVRLSLMIVVPMMIIATIMTIVIVVTMRIIMTIEIRRPVITDILLHHRHSAQQALPGEVRRRWFRKPDRLPTKSIGFYSNAVGLAQAASPLAPISRNFCRRSLIRAAGVLPASSASMASIALPTAAMVASRPR